MKTLACSAAVLLSLRASAPSIPAQTASAPTMAALLGAAMPGVTAQDMLTRALDSVRLP
jgi:hypothetical protein